VAGYLAWGAAIGAGFMVTGLFVVEISTREGLAELASDFLPQIAVLALGLALGETVRSRRALAAETATRLRLAEEERAAEAGRLVAEERLRIARELHDTVAHSMATITVQGAGVSGRGGAARPAAHPAERWAGVVQRHPVLAAVVSAAFILLLAAPALAMKLSFPDESAQARGTMGYASYATMAQGFGPGFDAPLIVAARVSPSDGARLASLRGAIAGTPGIAGVTAPVISRDGQAAVLIAYPTTGEQDPATNALVNRLADTVLPRSALTAYLTGPNASNVTFTDLLGERLPWLIGVVVGLSMILLLVVFRSVVIAVKAALMNLLSVCAAYGVLTAVTQWGWLGHAFGFPEKMPVTTWVPIFLFVILFGLSMDYEVFLLSKIREEYDRLGDNGRAVGRGLAATARVISAAAAIMVVVFLSFDLTPDVSVKQIGLGLAAAVLVDATVVRLVLVPAVMELLGRANWWLPSWLAGVLPAVRTEALGADEPPAGQPAADPVAARRGTEPAAAAHLYRARQRPAHGRRDGANGVAADGGRSSRREVRHGGGRGDEF
jgi:hypothetical protein